MVAPWLESHNAVKEEGGWSDDIIGPSAKILISAVERSIRTGFDVIEIHAAHGFLLHQFLSPVNNKRSDQYGGSFDNRIRLLLEIIQDTRLTIPETMPLFLRVSATDWLEDTDIEGWNLKETTQLSLKAAERGVDFIDVSSGGSHPAQIIKGDPAYQAGFSKHIKDVLKNKAFVGAVGTITNGVQANDLLNDGLDVILNGRLFQKNPGLVWSWADDLW
ncbi:hypothetical protein DID88_009194 [Monilinia fructigena]|uniref:NADH:flavin oxidoreductase/NADH oxidase N-terminal domain-containing protein n=1 Tax=Monilinia fructigena TaxID=38457 RepID=A0A395IF35_9HELO|nr:hypothetical protein DID88_009194 [Monilinia fructigena]